MAKRLDSKSRLNIALWVLFYLFLFTLFLFNSFRYLDNDLGWHLRVGEQILKDQAVPSADNYNYTLTGETWVDHEWLMDALFYWIYDKFGYIALNIFLTSLMVGTLILLALFTRKYFIKDGGMTAIMAITVIGSMGIMPHVGVRIQTVTIFLLLVMSFILTRYSREKNYRILLFLPPLFWLWANLHGGYLIGLFLLFLFTLVKAAEIYIVKTKCFKLVEYLDQTYLFTPHQAAILAIFAPLSTAATLLTPYGFKLYSFLIEYSNTFYFTHISEWLPAFTIPIQPFQLIFQVILFTAFLYLVAHVLNKNEEKQGSRTVIFKIDLWQLALAVLFLVLATKSKRHFPLLFIMTFPYLIYLLKQLFYIPKETMALIGYRKAIKIFTGLIIILITGTFFYRTDFNNNPWDSSRFCRSYPCQAVEFLKNHEDYKNLKLFSPYSWGGYLIWSWPDKKLFIDGRQPQRGFKDHSFLEEYYEFYAEDKLEDRLNEYGIEIVLMLKERPWRLSWIEKYIMRIDQDEYNDRKNHLRDFLNESEQWELVYTDNNSEIFIKTSD